MTKLSSRRKLLAIILAACSVGLLHTAVASAAPAAQPCSDVHVPVALSPSESPRYQVYGQLCRPPGVTHTVQVLVPGMTYDHTYWNLPEPGKSYSDAANRAGMATIALDRIGIGQSSHPPGLSVTVDSNAYVVHQVIQALRHGDAGLPQYSKVALVGHSYGSWTSWYEADRYHDADAVIFSGATHGVSVAKLPQLALFYPAPLDPELRGSVNDPIYITSIPGFRDLLFHQPGWVDPRLLSYDERHKQTSTVGELYNFPIILSRRLHVNVPAMVAMGSVDTLFCGGPIAPDCSTAASVVNYERPYLGATSLDGFVLPGSGHDLNYAPNADLWYAVANRWVADHVR